ncbi:DUF262 domain-containing protein [Pseudomonas sp. LPB0260]|uniref:DUF262 domain-containing protein n=1 Tax=Pseudomonas sp. LPB0260 TaxID=2614442 RepID=UPI0015C2190D|nr:DUF262 domain-containing protein [Pseudomonas sp. LPB0260]QLC73836.1 DUF262 domain-containing protein [Pseudomonas sp. LPB0260]QLC76610.1 DUF262 domain-containing protein [Pseudomonas sp. LPB0260]
MKNFDSRTYSINDFIEWHENGQLELSPKFQRRSVWTDTARSYLMDTIIDGKPIPKVFIRQKINPQTRKSIREVVDGQQRLRTILSFVKDGFVISKRHNKVYGGLYFSQLDGVDDDIQSQILNYEISVDLLVNMSDPDVLDIFSRLNSYSVTLNEQEKINANHFGPFKRLADNVAHKNNAFWIDNKIVSEQNVLRMHDVQLTADLLIGMVEGVRSKKQIRKYYEQYEHEFEYDTDDLEARFQSVIDIIKELFDDNFKKREFRRPHVFYSLFMTLYHMQYGVENLSSPRVDMNRIGYARISQNLERIDYIFEEEDKQLLSRDERQFLEDCRRATTDTAVRIRRSDFIAGVIAG